MTWDFDRPRVVILDGHPRGLVRRLRVEVQPDAAVLYA
jgi:hypothetical protein